MSFELAGWKAKIDNIVNKFDHLSTGAKERFIGEVNGLHIISDEMSERMLGLRSACDKNWQPQTEDHDVVWPSQKERSSSTVAQSDFGG